MNASRYYYTRYYYTLLLHILLLLLLLLQLSNKSISVTDERLFCSEYLAFRPFDRARDMTLLFHGPAVTPKP